MIIRLTVFSGTTQMKNFDGAVNFHDFASYCNGWKNNGTVDYSEFELFVNQWTWTSVWHRGVPGDIDNSKKVALRDFAFLAQKWNKQNTQTQVDLNLDGQVNNQEPEPIVERLA